MPQLAAIVCMIGCVLVFMWERKQTHGKIDLSHFGMAFLGILFDAGGVMMTRQAYEFTPSLGSFQVNATRAFGALLGFFILNPKSFSVIFSEVKLMKPKDQQLLIGASFLGTFVSLYLYLRALKTAHVATLSAICITLPIWVSLIEHTRDKTWPNRYLWTAFAIFLLGFYLMNFM
jgi:drug/metabolite transporter (DMT)-like permease